MVETHYRWDFIGLSTDQKPTPSTSEKVVNGSTYYTSDDSKLYVWYKDQWYEKTVSGGGASYTAGNGITISDGTIAVDPQYVATMAELDARINKGAGTPTTATVGVVGGLYEDTTNGKLYICTAVTAGTDPDPDTYTWSEVGAGGGGDTVYSTKTTSRYSNGGAVYIGNLNNQQVEQEDPTTTDHQYKYFWALPGSNSETPTDQSVNILGISIGSKGVCIGNAAQGVSNKSGNVLIGSNAVASGGYNVVLGSSANATTDNTVTIGRNSLNYYEHSIALGSYSQCTRPGELNVSTGSQSYGYNGTKNRVIGGVHDGIELNDAATVAQGNTLGSSAPTTSTAGVIGQLYTDTTAGKIYHCTAIDTTDPNNPSYTWAEIGAGGGGGLTLSTNDYNYPENNPTKVNLDKLDGGIYTATETIAVYMGGYNYTVNQGESIMLVKANEGKQTLWLTYTAFGAKLTISNNGNRVFDSNIICESNLSSKWLETNGYAPTVTTYGITGKILTTVDSNKVPHLFVCGGPDPNNAGQYLWYEATLTQI